jgi:hypothetical protein
MEGLEPPRLAAPDPKSGAATNYATCAFLDIQQLTIRFRKNEIKAAKIAIFRLSPKGYEYLVYQICRELK